MEASYKWLHKATPQGLSKFISYTEANLRRAKYRGGMTLLVPLWQYGLEKAKQIVDEIKRQ